MCPEKQNGHDHSGLFLLVHANGFKPPVFYFVSRGPAAPSHGRGFTPACAVRQCLEE